MKNPVFLPPNSEMNRRDFLSMVAASMALAGLTGCSAAKPEHIVPYVRMPENVLPGAPVFFATAMPLFGYGVGLIVESQEGRPIKVDGNPDHPANLGGTDAFIQASLLTLYDPDRAQTLTNTGQIATWDSFVSQLQGRLQSMPAGGDRLRILTETVASPSLTDLFRQVLAKYPNAKWVQYEPVNRDNARAGARMAFGRYVDTQYRFADADLIVSLDSDFFMWEPGKLRYTREFARRRRTAPGQNRMNRLYVIESSPTITGAKADHRISLKASAISRVAGALAMRESVPEIRWLDSLFADLEEFRGRSIIIAGESQPSEVHALVHSLNASLGNVGRTVLYTDPIESNAVEQTSALRQLADDIAANRVDTLISMGGNPVYTAPADLDMATLFGKVPFTVHHSLYYDETAAASRWHIPESHYLESWGDIRAYDGTVSIIQPLLLPLYQSRSPHELFSALLGNPTRTNHELVREYWMGQRQGDDFEPFWRSILREGVVPNTQAPIVNVSAAPPSITPSSSIPSTDIEINIRPDPTVFDGRWANNAWLQEAPKPLTQLVWDNAAVVSAGTAARLELENEDVIRINSGGRSVEAAVWVLPGQPDDSITLHLGYGRDRAGSVGAGRGFNAYRIRTSETPWLLGASIEKTGDRYSLVTTQKHHEIGDRHIVRSSTQEDYARRPNFVQELTHVPHPEQTLYPPWENSDYSWGMAIDLSTCIGCNACVIACQAENNIPTVGKGEVSNGREMHWIRIDTYREGPGENPEVYFQPMLCQHCENAPCELVCPVAATSHSAEGLNEMTYNRCVGTRYCSNNCPYKVRRFNFLQYTNWDVPQLKMLHNPDVTVRSRGVMEKCTYCVQRINRARIEAKKEDRKINDGEVVTACEAACPAEAIVFGNLLDPNSRVSKAKAEPRNYGVLTELNTRPRTTYLAKLTNPKDGI